MWKHRLDKDCPHQGDQSFASMLQLATFQIKSKKHPSSAHKGNALKRRMCNNVFHGFESKCRFLGFVILQSLFGCRFTATKSIHTHNRIFLDWVTQGCMNWFPCMESAVWSWVVKTHLFFVKTNHLVQSFMDVTNGVRLIVKEVKVARPPTGAIHRLDLNDHFVNLSRLVVLGCPRKLVNG